MDLNCHLDGLTDVNNNSTEANKDHLLRASEGVRARQESLDLIQLVEEVTSPTKAFPSPPLNRKQSEKLPQSSIENDENDEEEEEDEGGENHKCVFRPFTRESMRKITRRIDREKKKELQR